MPIVEPFFEPLKGLHHVTAIAGDPAQNYQFYSGVLGLRLVKQSVNQDDPSIYHLFYGDAIGTPGTVLTFFAGSNQRKGHPGHGQATEVALSIPSRSLSYWKDRLQKAGFSPQELSSWAGEKGLHVQDPDGLSLLLVAGRRTGQRKEWKYWEHSPVPEEYAIRGLHSVTLTEKSTEPTFSFLTGVLAFQKVVHRSNRIRLSPGGNRPGSLLDLHIDPEAPRSYYGTGTIHHVAWRTSDETTQRYWQQEIARTGIHVSPPIDRFWFKSIYFHEPGGVLFEIATERPGFTRDEPIEHLGEHLSLPPWLEPQREEIEEKLPPFNPKFLD